MAKHFVLALINKEHGVYGIHFPDYPGVVSGGESFQDAVNRGANSLAFHLQGMAEDGDEIRLPPSQDEAFHAAFGEVSAGAMPAFIEIEFPGKAVRVNISIEENLLSQVDSAARAQGMSRSAFLANAVRSSLKVA